MYTYTCSLNLQEFLFSFIVMQKSIIVHVNEGLNIT